MYFFQFFLIKHPSYQIIMLLFECLSLNISLKSINIVKLTNYFRIMRIAVHSCYRGVLLGWVDQYWLLRTGSKEVLGRDFESWEDDHFNILYLFYSKNTIKVWCNTMKSSMLIFTGIYKLKHYYYCTKFMFFSFWIFYRVLEKYFHLNVQVRFLWGVH